MIEQLEAWMTSVEGENFEFKEAKNRFSFEELAKYACALANEGGGRIILGVTDKRPRRVVGSRAFQQPESTCRKLMDLIHIQVGLDEIVHPDGRVLVFQVPCHPVGMAIKYKGIYWSREADSLVPMSEEKLRSILMAAGHDFSSDICPGATLSDLDTAAIEDFRRRWINKSGNRGLTNITVEQLLRDAELLSDQGITFAALVLMGTRHALTRYLAQAEVIFEYRSSDASGPAQKRVEYREGFFAYYEKLWDTINLRNDVQHYQDGLFVLDIPTFDERSVREAILNAISHRDYQFGGSIFIRQFPRRLTLENPGGFPMGITVENILERQLPRNRRIAEAFARCGLVERSGQGMNLMFEHSIQHGKHKPSFEGTDAYNVVLTLDGQVNEPHFVQFLEKVGREKTALFSTEDFLILDNVHNGKEVPERLYPRLRNLQELGVIESIGEGRGTRYLLSRQYYSIAGKKGSYTRKKGLDRQTNKALLLQHIQESADSGTTLSELKQVLPAMSHNYVQWMMRELKDEGKVRVTGRGSAARWFPVDDSE